MSRRKTAHRSRSPMAEALGLLGEVLESTQMKLLRELAKGKRASLCEQTGISAEKWEP